MSDTFTRTFYAEEGDHSVDNAGPEALIRDIDALGAVANGSVEALSGKMDKNNPRGTGSFAMNLLNENTNVGANSFSMNNGVATGDSATAEGSSTANGLLSHAEGTSQANAQASHSEGNGTYIHNTARASHAEGEATSTYGVASHSEGGSCHSNGDYSHSEGLCTDALGEAQHVQGKYNIEDTEGKYAHIVGGGSPSERKNIHTLDWSGNAEYAGDMKSKTVTVTGTIKANGNRIEMTGGGIAQTASGDLALGNFNKIDVDFAPIKNVGSPTASTDAATKGYVDAGFTGVYTKSESESLVDNATAELIKSFNYDSKSGVLTAIRDNGTTFQVFDINVEKIPSEIAVVAEDGRVYIRITTDDGKFTETEITEFIRPVTFVDGTTIDFTPGTASTGGPMVTAEVKDGSITNAKLHTSVMSSINSAVSSASGSATSAGQSATSANTSAGSASTSAKTAQSYAVGGTNSRTGENTDNAKYYSNLAKTYKDNAENASSTATTKAGEASQSASTATTKADEATASATNAASSEGNAATYAANASASATAAANSATSAASAASTAATSAAEIAATSAATQTATALRTELDGYAKEAKSYAVGGTGTRTGEDADNAKYYKERCEDIAGSISSFSFIVVDTLPPTGSSGVMYFVPNSSGSTEDTYDEYVWIASASKYERVGSTAVDVSNLLTKANPVATGSFSLGRHSTNAIGTNSFACGDSVTASGECSHAEGYNTLASSQYQHVQGKYNVADSNNTYAHIVGGGTSGTDRKNIHTLDWSGNAIYSGDVTATKSDGTTVSLIDVAENSGSGEKDWNENDSTSDKYIENRTHWKEEGTPVTFFEVSADDENWRENTGTTSIGGHYYISVYDSDSNYDSSLFIVGADVIVTINGVDYNRTLVSDYGDIATDYWDTVSDFYIYHSEDYLWVAVSKSMSESKPSVSMKSSGSVYHQLSDIYIPSSIARTGDLDNYVRCVNVFSTYNPISSYPISGQGVCEAISNLTASDVGLGNVGNFKAVSTVASQGLTTTEKTNARTNIGAGTSSLTIGTTATTAAAGNHTHSTYVPTTRKVNNKALSADITLSASDVGVTFATTYSATNTTSAMTGKAVAAALASQTTETWTFTLDDGTTVTKKVVVR